MALVLFLQRYRQATRPARRSPVRGPDRGLRGADDARDLLPGPAARARRRGRGIAACPGADRADRRSAGLFRGPGRARFFQGAALAKLIQGLGASRGAGPPARRDGRLAGRPLARRSPTGCRTCAATSTPTASRWSCRPPTARVRAGRRSSTTVRRWRRSRTIAPWPTSRSSSGRPGAAAALALERDASTPSCAPTSPSCTASARGSSTPGDEERRRLERDLHDGAQQRLVAMLLTLSSPAAATDPTPSASAASTAARQQSAGCEALAELRDLAHGILPPCSATAVWRRRSTTSSARLPVPVDDQASRTSGSRRSVEAAAYFVVAEALTNAVKYARAGRPR